MDTSEKLECYVWGQCEVGFNTHSAGFGVKYLPVASWRWQERTQSSPQSHNMDIASQPSTVLKSYLGLNVCLFLYSRNIRSISKNTTLLRPVTNSVAKMMTASGGHGYRTIRSAVSLPIALTQYIEQDIQMLSPAQTASVDSMRKHSIFCHYQFFPPLPSLLGVTQEIVTANTNVRGFLWTQKWWTT